MATPRSTRRSPPSPRSGARSASSPEASREDVDMKALVNLKPEAGLWPGALPTRNAYPIPAGLSDDVAAILDPLGNAAHTALSYDLVGEDVLVAGAGPIGLMAAAIARHVGARHVVVTDVNEYRLGLAAKVG